MRVAPWIASAVWLLLVCGGGLVAADTCRVTAGTCSWGPIGSHAGCTVSCGTIDGDDTVIIEDGARMECAGDLTWNDSPGASLQVKDGGELDCRAQDDGFVLTLGSASPGLVCFQGSTCSFAPRYRSYGPSPPAPQVSRDVVAAQWPVGELLFCPDASDEPDCDGAQGGNGSILRLIYDAASHPDAAEAIGDLDPGVDLFCPWDFDESDDVVPYEAGFCHPVVGTGGQGARTWLEIDVDGNSTEDPGGYPLALRRNVMTTLAAPAAPGERSVLLNCGPAETSCHLDTEGDRTYIGYWMYLADSDGAVTEGPYKIVDTRFEAPGDPSDTARLTLMRAGRNNSRGLDLLHDGSGLVFLSYVGLLPGDPFYVQAPIKITSASPPEVDPTDGAIFLAGTTRAQGMWLEDIRSLSIQAGTVVGEIRDIVKRGGGDGAAFTGEAFNLGLSGVTVDHFVNSGDEPGFTDHGLRITQDAAGTHLRHLYFQFNGDDDVVFNSSVGAGHSIEYVHVRHESAGDNSSEIFDLQNSQGGPFLGETPIRGVVCEGRCGHLPYSRIVDSGPDNTATLSDLVVLGHPGPLALPATVRVRNLFAVNVEISPVGGSSLLPDDVDGCVVRDVQLAGSSRLLLGGDGVVRRNCLLHDIHLERASDQGLIQAGSTHENLAFVDIGSSGPCTGDCRLLGFGPGGIGPLSRLAFVLTPGFAADLNTYVDQQTSDSDFVAGTVDRMLFAHLARSPSALRAYESHDPEALGKFGDRFCFWDNVEDANDPGAMTGPMTTGQPTVFLDLASGRVDQAVASPCPESGTDDAGLPEMNWALAKTGLGPEHTGAISDIALYGSAHGGTVRLWIDGVTLEVATAAGQGPESVLDALAAAINADTALAGMGVSAQRSGQTLETSGDIWGLALQDAGLTSAGPRAIPGLPAPALATLVLLAAVLAASRASRRI